jgi:hypothetical protein
MSLPSAIENFDVPEKCPHDYYGTHCFERVGVWDRRLWFRCSQCHKYFFEVIDVFNYRNGEKVDD